MKKINRSKQRSNQHRRKFNPKTTQRKGLIIGRKRRYNGGLLNLFKK